MANATIDQLASDFTKSSSFPYAKNKQNRHIVKIIIRLFIHYSFMAAMNGFTITTKSINGYIRLRLRMVMEKPRSLTLIEKNVFLTSYRKFGYMFRFDVFGVHLGRGNYHFLAEPGMMADLQDTINSNTIYALTHEKSFH